MLGPARFVNVSGGSPLSMAGQSGDTPHSQLLPAAYAAPPSGPRD
jgi:hypothetical protein